ncbi:MAG: phospho-N-acetylmuramoyl-pentapeptide-transferase [Hyphomonadaceae bacterium]|nr:phospho-N-acetylmuramoyl-pentapeptide-transferase [Hyphomonadaceae bacterium]
MLKLLSGLEEYAQIFNLFKYITFRTGGAIVTALVVAFVIGAPMIAWLRKKQGRGQPIRELGPEGHLLTKAGTPTMGGFIILISVGVAALLWGDLQNPYVWSVLIVTAGFGAIGFIDDYRKVTKQSHDGLSGRLRLTLEFLIALAATLIMMAAQWVSTAGPSTDGQFWEALFSGGMHTAVAVPFFKSVILQLGPVFIFFAMFVIVGAGNAVNLTDGLDGLAIVPVMIAAVAFGFICYFAGNAVYANYLVIHHVRGAGELCVLLGALLGASLGFLWYNAPPARVFMGDTGSLALGGMLGAVAVATKHEIVLGVIGGLFVLEALSVMIQVGWFKMTKKRVFLMAPFHHHFEKLGWAEPTIVIRFWIVATIFALAGLATLKLR